MVMIGNFEVHTDYLYLNTIVWVNRISDSELLIGITDYGQQTLKDITSVQLPSKGERYTSDSSMIMIETISQEYELNSPASCSVLEINLDASTSPDLINERPYETWLARLEVLDMGDLDNLMDADSIADELLDEVGAAAADNISFDDDFDYEQEFSIDSSDSYYEEEEEEYW